MTKEFTQEMVDRLNNAWEDTKGTSDWGKYLMEHSMKYNKKWSFMGHNIPSKTGVFKKYRNTIYIYTSDDDRYEVHEHVMKLLNIKTPN